MAQYCVITRQHVSKRLLRAMVIVLRRLGTAAMLMSARGVRRASPITRYALSAPSRRAGLHLRWCPDAERNPNETSNRFRSKLPEQTERNPNETHLFKSFVRFRSGGAFRPNEIRTKLVGGFRSVFGAAPHL